MKAVGTVTIVSLSRGILGESFVKHELDIGVRRLKEIGLEVRFSAHCLSGLEYIEQHPEARARDLLDAFRSDTDMILCAIGGDDTYRLLPWLFEHDELRKAVSRKVFLGYSDSTVNHLMLHKVGLNTFYGQAFLSDVCELAPNMLPYTKAYFEELIATGTIRRITPSPVWYETRQSFGVEALGTEPAAHENPGFALLQGEPAFRGPILGGCIDTLYDMLANEQYPESIALCSRYGIFPRPEDWEGKILLLESSEVQAPPEKYRRMVRALKQTGVFEAVNGVLMGKPEGEKYFTEYKEILLEEIDCPSLPVVANVSVGHALPRCIIPLGVEAVVDTENQEITFLTNQ